MVEIFAQRWSKPRGNSNEEGCLIDVISFRRVHRDETCISRVKFKIQPLIMNSNVETKRSHSPFLFDHVEKTKRNEWKEVRRAFGVNEKRARRIYRKIMWYSKPSRPFSPPFFAPMLSSNSKTFKQPPLRESSILVRGRVVSNIVNRGKFR